MIRRRELRSLSAGALCVGALLLGAQALGMDTPWHCDRTAMNNGLAGTLEVSAGAEGFVIVEERGVELQYRRGSEAPRPISFSGPRLGWLVVAQDGVSFSISSMTQARLTARLHQGCHWLPGREEWMRQAMALAAQVDPSVSFAGEVSAFERLADTAPAPFERAAGHQLWAAALYRVGRYTDAAKRYADAATMWMQLGDRERAGAMLLGLSDMRRLTSELPASDASAREALALLTTPATAYFALRARENQCQVLHWNQQWDAARQCMSGLADAFRALGDLDGYVNASTNELALRRDQGIPVDVAAEQRRYADIQTHPDVGPMRRGRWLLTLAMTLRDQGNVIDALRGFNQALQQFERAPEERERWVASTLFQVAGLYTDLGMYAQAYETHRQGLNAMALLTAPGRVAAALARFADIDRRAGNRSRAALWSSQSAEVYRALGMPGELAIALLTSTELEMDQNPPVLPDDARMRQLRRDLPAHARARLALLEARVALAEHGKASVRWSGTGAIPLAAQLDAVVLDAGSALASGSIQDAASIYAEALAQTATLAARSANPALAYMVLQSTRGLRGRAAPLLSQLTDPEGTERLSRALLATQPLAQFRPLARNDDRSFEFSAAVARRLIYGLDTQGAAAEIERLSDLQPAAHESSEAQLGIAALRATLNPGDALLMVFPGTEQSTVGLVSQVGVQWRRAPNEESLAAMVRKLLFQLERRGDWNDLDASLREVETALLAPFAGEPLPARLLVLYEESAAMIPWSALRWPGQPDPLVASTAVSWITRWSSDAEPPAAETRDLHLVIANPRSAVGTLRLADLPNAEQEDALIRLGQPALDMQVQRNEDASAARFQALLDHSTGIVHVAAHGQKSAGLLGYAGLWFSPLAGTSEPQFLSWMDLADRPIRARLVVLNACQLAAGPTRAGHGSMSFATAVSAAGAGNVVAALWPVSDTAATVWVPAFYRALDLQDLDSSAEALRQAQLALRASRHFRHPYYWASLAHFRRLAVPVAEDERAVPAARQLAQGSADAPQSR